MLLDVTRPALLTLIDECPKSLVVRALRKEHGDGGIWHYSVEKRRGSYHNEVTPLKEDRRALRNGLLLTETRIPIEKSLPFGYVKQDVSLERFEVQSLHTVAMASTTRYSMWRLAIEVKWENHGTKQRWFVSVQDVAKSVELGAFRAQGLIAAAVDEFPLDRANVEGVRVPVPPQGTQTAWGRLLDD